MKLEPFWVWILVLFSFVWPVPSTADEDQPWGSSPPQELLNLLQEIHERYGTDAVTLVSWLLDATVRSGSILTASIKVNGLEDHASQRFLAFQVQTGIIFNTLALDQAGRLNALWERILAPTFTHLDTLTVPADGVAINLLYNHKPYQNAEELRRTLDDTGTPEEAKFYFPTEALRAYLNRTLSAQGLINRSTVTVNRMPVRLLLFTTSTDGRRNSTTQTIKRQEQWPPSLILPPE